MNQAQFRIGGVYRDGRGDLYELMKVGGDRLAESLRRDETTGETSSVPSGMHNLADGRVTWAQNDNCPFNLLPGELQFKDGRWVAVEEDKQIDPLFAAAHYGHDLIPVAAEPNAAMIARDGHAKPTPIRFTCVDCTGCAKCAPKSNAKPALAALTRLSDVHAPLHGSAHLVG